MKSGANAAAKTGMEEALGGVLGKLNFIPENAGGDYITDMISSGAVNDLSGDDKKNGNKK
ncbi:hypothetical protein AHV17_004589 [Salmonella enterica subsp. enterica serovar Texas]|nr:hypothetical protein [Salmonella enterica subsp. enterica serovar Texas]